MRNLITTVVILALLDSPLSIAQTVGSPRRSTESTAREATSQLLAQDTRWIGSAPIGHRQPHVSDVPSEKSSELEHIGAEDAEVDRKLNICRGC